MSRHLQILRKARLDADLFGRPEALPPDPPQRLRPVPVGSTTASRDHWQRLVHELFLRRQPARCAVALASATAGEGASFVAFHLAGELARSTTAPTVLLELNLYRPVMAERFGVDPDPGLRQALADPRIPIEDCLRQTAVERLWLLPAGSAQDGGGQPPDWGRFRRIFSVLRERFPGMVGDLPPINLSTDFLLVAPLFDGVVLVVQADCCSREVIRNAAFRLQKACSNVVGTVLNKRKFVIPAPLYRRL